MFGFRSHKPKRSEQDTTSVLKELPHISSKFRVLVVEKSQFLIPLELGCIDETECALLYKSWEAEFKKTLLMSQIINNELYVFKNSNPTSRSKLQSLFESLNIKELTVSDDHSSSEDSAYTYKNDTISSGLIVNYNVDDNKFSELEVKNSDNIVVLHMFIDKNMYINQSSYTWTLKSFIPGNWITDISYALNQVHQFKENEDRKWSDNLELERTVKTRMLISEAMKIN